MQSLLEVVFGIAFFMLLIWALPAIMGVFSLGVIAYIAFTIVKSISGGSSGNAQNGANKRPEAQHEPETKTTEHAQHYSGPRYSRRRYYDGDDYERYNDSYYNDWDNDNVPPDDEIHFRGTGGPFL